MEKIEDVEVVKDGDIYLVRGEWARKLVGSINMSSYESLQYFQRTLIKKGVMKQLEDLGLKDGDTVIVHDFEFDYVK